MRFPRVVRVASLLFCVAWMMAVGAFPAEKGMLSGYVPVVIGVAFGVAALRSTAVSRAIDLIEGWPSRHFLVLLIGTALVLRLAAVAYFPLEPRSDDEQFQRYAEALVRGEGYGVLNFRAFFPPGMSLVLAAWYFVTGSSPVAGKLLNVLFGCLLTWQVWAAARSAIGERAARVAGLLAALFPTLVFYSATLGYETLLALIFVLVYRLASASPRSGGRASTRPGRLNAGFSSNGVAWTALVAVGALLGVGALVKPICLLVPFVLAIAWWTQRATIAAAAGRAIVVAVVMAAVVSPWTIRNHRVLGAFVPVSTNGGWTLYVANNPSATGLATPPTALPTDTAGEADRDRFRMHAALSWIAAHPARWLSLALVKVTYTWGTTSSIMAVVSTDRLPAASEALCKLILNVAWTALLVWCGVAAWTRKAWTWPALFPASLFVWYVFGLHLFYEAHSRHHIPVLAFLLMIGAVSLARVPMPPAFVEPADPGSGRA